MTTQHDRTAAPDRHRAEVIDAPLRADVRRITTLLETDRLTADLGLDPIGPAADRMMRCGSPAFLTDMVALLDKAGVREGSSSTPGEYVIEKAFVEK